MIYAIMFIINIVAVLIWRYFDEYRNEKSEIVYGFTLGFCFAMVLVFVNYGVKGYYSPSAQDVVDGKTTFKVTYIDNVPTDSIAIYKDEYKHINWQ